MTPTETKPIYCTVSNSSWALKLDHKTSQSLLKRHLTVNMINVNVPEKIEHQSLPRPQLMLCKPWHLDYDKLRWQKRSNIRCLVPCRKFLLSKEIQPIHANMSRQEFPPPTQVKSNLYRLRVQMMWCHGELDVVHSSKNLQAGPHAVIRLSNRESPEG